MHKKRKKKEQRRKKCHTAKDQSRVSVYFDMRAVILIGS